jgi:hypothetical protein
MIEAGPAEPRVIPPQQNFPIEWASPDEQELLEVFFPLNMLRVRV